MVQGIEKLKRRLVDVIPKKAREALEEAMLQSADLIVAGAKLRVPVESGELRDSIHRTEVRVSKRGGFYVAIAAGKPPMTQPSSYPYGRISRLTSRR
jgi:hypothetical protein